VNAGPPPDWPGAAQSFALVRRLLVLYALATAGVLASLMFPQPVFQAARASGTTGIVAGALLIALAGLLGSCKLARARLQRPAVRRALPRWMRLPQSSAGTDPLSRISLAARRPQGVLVPLAAGAAIGCVWLLQPQAMLANAANLLGGGLILLGFPLLVGERFAAALPEKSLPEARSLQALLLVPAVVIPAAGALEIAGGLGAGWIARGITAGIGLYRCLTATEIACRALARWFLPPPSPATARAAIDSLTARLLRPGRLAAGGLGAPIREHLGIDFSRSWALQFVRAAALPVLLALLLAGWGLTGVSLIDLDRRGIQERFGAPVAVLQPGLHAGLPWPLGSVRQVDFGVVHAIPLGAAGSELFIGAEDPPPPAADRLWETAHPAELSYIVASTSNQATQSFQSVSVDMRVLYRIGMDDASALRAAYAQTDPDALLRAEAGRLVARFFASRTLPALLGAGREKMAETLQAELQQAIGRFATGIEIVDVVIEAIHPPAGAADAYHQVQAAGIMASTAISAERGRAVAVANLASQQASELLAGAAGQAAETVGSASAGLIRFTADQRAAATGGQAFLLERYFTNLVTALTKAPLVIVDHRLGGADGPVIDLRQFAAPGTNDSP
jgi:regulator of protease activity HflC (stomatin/prohibitin superfamily)